MHFTIISKLVILQRTQRKSSARVPIRMYSGIFEKAVSLDGIGTHFLKIGPICSLIMFGCHTHCGVFLSLLAVFPLRANARHVDTSVQLCRFSWSHQRQRNIVINWL